MDAATLSAAMGGRLSMADYEKYTPAMNNAMIQADCTTVNRAAMWCAQMGHESAGLFYLEEIADGRDYNGRADLGNTQPGDGPRYKGRGIVQLTGRANYGAFSRWAHGKGLVPTPTYFVDNPTIVATPEWAFLPASWYWTVARSQINSMCDRRDLVGVTRAINGGTNGIDDRTNRWNRCLALGEALLPEEDFDMASEAKDVQEQLRGPALDGWPQLGDFLAPKRTVVNALGRLLQIGNFQVAQLDTLTGKKPSIVNPEKSFDAGEYLRLIDAAAFRIEAAVKRVEDLLTPKDGK